MDKIRIFWSKEKEIVYFVLLLALIVFCVFYKVCTNTTNTYAVKTPTKQTNGTYYKYASIYSVKGTYLGDGKFIDVKGKEWYRSSTLQKGEHCTLTLHNNGTTDRNDDVIIKVNKEE